jgi:hypothetical protein
MSTNLLLAPWPDSAPPETFTMYRDVLAKLPLGISVAWKFEPKGDAYKVSGNGGRSCRTSKPCYAFPIPHALLEDKCGNTIWMAEAVENDLKYHNARVMGEATFEQFGMQGSIVHFGNAFEEQDLVLFESMYGFDYNSETCVWTPKNPPYSSEDFGDWEECGLVSPEREDCDNNLCRFCHNPLL